jgi:hypothetical protein
VVLRAVARFALAGASPSDVAAVRVVRRIAGLRVVVDFDLWPLGMVSSLDVVSAVARRARRGRTRSPVMVPP